MADAGFPFDSSEEAQDLVNERFSAIVEIRDADGDWETEDDVYVYDTAELEALRELERAIAGADFACSEPLRAEAAKIYAEYEQRFVDEHPELIEEARRILGGG